MALKEMADYFSSTLAADYTAETLSLPPSVVLVEEGDKNQVIHRAADGSRQVITFGSDSIFEVVIQWLSLEPSDAGIIIDLFHNSSKANGFENSFQWSHPTDGHVYTVAFKTKVPREISTPGYHSVKKIRLDVLGYSS